MILQHGADPNKKNRDGHTPLDLVKEGDQDVADLLRGLITCCLFPSFLPVFSFPPHYPSEIVIV